MECGTSLAPFQPKWNFLTSLKPNGITGSGWISLSKMAGNCGPNWDQIVDQWSAT